MYQLKISDLRWEGEEGVAAWHLDLDTGMGRSGFDWRCASTWLPEVARRSEGLRWAGAYTHLHSADDGEAAVHEQWERFAGVMDRVDPGEDFVIHVLNSAGVFRTPEYVRSMARPGIFLYGGGIGPGQPRPRPVVSWHGRRSPHGPVEAVSKSALEVPPTVLSRADGAASDLIVYDSRV